MIYSSIKRVFFCIAESAVKGGQGSEEWGRERGVGEEGTPGSAYSHAIKCTRIQVYIKGLCILTLRCTIATRRKQKSTCFRLTRRIVFDLFCASKRRGEHSSHHQQPYTHRIPCIMSVYTGECEWMR